MSSKSTESIEKMDNWKQFQGTELGAMMSQIYGNQYKPVINYPKPKVSKAFQTDQKYIPYKGTASEESLKNATKKNVKVSIPRPVSKGRMSSSSDIDERRSFCPVDLIPKRRHMDIISNEIATIKMKQEHYRPAHVKPTSTDYEKDRLSQIFECKGGKILPTELTNAVSDTPFEVMARKKEIERIEAIKEKRGLVTKKKSAQLSPTEQLAEQITKEIEERRHYLNEMKGSGLLSKQEEDRILMEIRRRIDELKLIDT